MHEPAIYALLYPVTDKEKAEAQGFTVDTHCYPWVAYKGPRFDPIEWHHILTDKESELLLACDTAAKNANPRDWWQEICRVVVEKARRFT